jgi:hypothetical protein
MAKSAKSKAATVENHGQEVSAEKKAKKMTKEEAQSIVDQHVGIDGVDIPELTEAKAVLKSKGE